MDEIVGYIPPMLLVDVDSGRRLPNAEVQAFAMTDTEYSSPLPITDMQGVPYTGNTFQSNSDAVTPAIRPPEGVTQLVLRSGTAVTPVTDISLHVRASVEAASTASEAATAAQQDRLQAQQASQTATDAAAVLRELAENQGVPLAPNPARPGTFIILNPAALVEDPTRPGTFKNGVTA